MNSLFKFDLESCFISCYAPCHVFSILNKPLHSYECSFLIYIFVLCSVILPIYYLINIKSPYNVFLYLSIFCYGVLSLLHYNTRQYRYYSENKYYSFLISFFLPICSMSQIYRDNDSIIV
jgi:hypothetical protein